jgi:hypothetical protein
LESKQRADGCFDAVGDDADRFGDAQRPEIAGSENVDGAVVVGLIMSELKGAARCGSRAIARIAARAGNPAFIRRLRGCRIGEKAASSSEDSDWRERFCMMKPFPFD